LAGASCTYISLCPPPTSHIITPPLSPHYLLTTPTNNNLCSCSVQSQDPSRTLFQYFQLFFDIVYWWLVQGIAMSSPSPTQSVQHTPTISIHQEEVHRYRQTIYHDKAGVRVAESRRRTGLARKVETSAQTYVDFVLYPMDSIQSTSESYSHDSWCCAAPKVRVTKSCSKPHVTYAKHSSKIRPKPAIIQRTSEPRRKLSEGEKTGFDFLEEPTPPPTPRLPRLPTPELLDLNEALFCDCGIGGHIVKRCRTCNKEVDLRLS
jgi:hypothetical protein